jgi:RNA polymerase sigma-70 factor (ECF subfamily)
VSLRSLLDHLGLPPDANHERVGLAASVPASVPLGGLGAPGLVATPAPVGVASSAELELVERARRGDQEAFAVLVRLHQRQVYTLALRMLRDEEEAVEATQEVFLAAWQGLRGFRAEARLATWLYRITYNHCLKVAERRQRDAQARAELASESAQAEHPAARLSQLHAQAALRDLCDMVRAEIANLPPKYRAVLSLRHLQDLSYEEMATVLGMPIGTVKTHLFRARAILRQRLTDLDRAASGSMSRAGELSAGLRDLIGKRLEGLRKEADQ